MIAILKKEILSFFSSPVGYLVISVFLILNGLFLFIFNGPYNILDNAIANLNTFFDLSPWVLLFIVPAVTMRSISEEKKQGTLELLLTKPISSLKIVLGKFAGVVLLVLLALIPTFLYVLSINQLANPVGNIDFGSIIGSYIGVLFLVFAYAAIGVFASTLSNNQIVAFILGVVMCFVMYYGFEALANSNITSEFFAVESLGLAAHFKSMSRGILDSRDLIYFLSISSFFIISTSVILIKK